MMWNAKAFSIALAIGLAMTFAAGASAVILLLIILDWALPLFDAMTS